MAAIFGKEEAARQEEFAQFPEEESGRPLWKTVTYMAGMVVFLVFANWAAPKTPNSFWEVLQHEVDTCRSGPGCNGAYFSHVVQQRGGEWFSSTWGYALQVVPLLFGGVLVADSFSAVRDMRPLSSRYVAMLVERSAGANFFAAITSQPLQKSLSAGLRCRNG